MKPKAVCSESENDAFLTLRKARANNDRYKDAGVMLSPYLRRNA